MNEGYGKELKEGREASEEKGRGTKGMEDGIDSEERRTGKRDERKGKKYGLKKGMG